MRGIARVFLLQNEKDSALYYYQQALDCALADQDSSLIGALYHDLAMVYSEKKDYIQADKFVSKASLLQGQDAIVRTWMSLIFMERPFVMMVCIR